MPLPHKAWKLKVFVDEISKKKKINYYRTIIGKVFWGGGLFAKGAK